jgi:WD40 repeat protein
VFMQGNSAIVLEHYLASGATEVASTQFIVPGATPGLVWFIGTGTEVASAFESVSQVDLVSGTVGGHVETDIWRAVVGVADGLIVGPWDQETFGRFAYWSPKSGIVSLDLPDPDTTTFEAASGDLAVAVSPDVVSVLNVRNGDVEAEFPIDFEGGTVRSVCVSPDYASVVVVWSNGEAFVGNIRTGEIMPMSNIVDPVAHGIRSAVWASADQLVYVVDRGIEIVVEALDIATGHRSNIATLEGSVNWLLAANAAMC